MSDNCICKFIIVGYKWNYNIAALRNVYKKTCSKRRVAVDTSDAEPFASL